MVFSIISIILMGLMVNMSVPMARGSSFLLFCISLVLLAIVPFFGFHTKGAKRWLHIAGLSIQPSEFIKPSLVLFFSHFLDKFSRDNDPKKLLIPMIVGLAAIFLIFRQPDIGTFLLIGAVLSAQVLMTGFFKPRHYLYMLIAFTTVLTIMYLTLPHVSDRVTNFLAGAKNISRANYQVRESALAYQNAGWLGRGFLEGKVKNHIPDIHTDFIFPAIAEEFGFLIAFLIVLIYFYIAIRVTAKAKQKKSNYEFLAINGLNLLLILQTSINICVSLNLLPTKGITLPFLSYGGSSTLGATITAGYILIFTKKEFGVVETTGD
jgi:cell division protein FtsW